MVEIPLSSQAYPGMVAQVDDEDAEIVSGYAWRVVHNKNSQTLYASAHVPGNHSKQVTMHRLIVDAPHRMSVDHIDRNGLNNTRTNLRVATASQQQANQGLRCTNTTGYKGVYWDKAKNKYRASISVNYKRYNLGRYADPKDAARAYDRAAIESFGPFAHVNFPETRA